MQTAVWLLLGTAIGTICGCGGLLWAGRMLKTRGREERFSPSARVLLPVFGAVCGGILGVFIRQVLPLAAALALLTVGIAVAVCDWLCRIIPNDTVLSVFGLKLVLMAAALVRIPGAPPLGLLSALGGLAFCFAVFFAPGLMGKRVGAGDVKLAAAMGFLLGFGNSLVAVVLMGVLMLGYSMVQNKMPLLAFLKTDIPMGPFLAAGLLMAWALPYLPL